MLMMRHARHLILPLLNLRTDSLTESFLVTRWQVDQWFFNNVNTIERKTKDAIAARLGGVMVWEVGQDCASYKDGPCNPHNTAHEVAPARFESRSLLAAVGRAVRKQRSVLQAQAAGAEVKEEL